MFAPQGYVNFADLVTITRRFAKGAWASVPGNRYFEGPPRDEMFDEEREFFMGVNILAGIVMCHALRSGDTILFSPSGHVVKPASLILKHQEDLHIYQGILPLGESAALTDLHEAYMGKLGDPLKRWRFIDSTTGTISAKNREAELEAFKYQSSEDLTNQISVAMQFEGWAVCLHESYSITEGFMDTFNISEEKAKEFEARAMEAKGPGRPRTSDAALQVYDNIPESERNSLTWKSLAAKVEEISGINIHHDTLLRSVNRRDKSADGADKIKSKTDKIKKKTD